MSRSSLGIGSMRPSIGSHQLGSINNQKILSSSISNIIRLNPTEEIINLTNNDKSSLSI